MTVHMIRVVTSTGGDYTLDALNTAMDDWVANHSEWTADPDAHTITENESRDESTPAYRIGTYRFLLEDAKDNLLQKCEDKLQNKVEWYRLGYHACTHDEDDPSPCGWDDQREWTAKDVTIPDGIPVFIEDGG